MKRIADLMDPMWSVQGDATCPVTDIVFDSRHVKPGALYVAIPGTRCDGHDFVAEALRSGASGAVVQKWVPANGTVIRVPDTLQALTHLSVRFWDNPSRRLRMVGITGTNGKTTTTYLVESIFEAAGRKTGVLGTINYRFNGHSRTAPNTTPFASDLHRFIAQVADGGGAACVMEVSSHALALGRTQGIDFDVAVFTNLTQDHLDFHGTLEEYAKAKSLLFSRLDPASPKQPKTAVINLDDPWAPTMRRASRVPVLGYSMQGAEADITVKNLHSDASGSRFDLVIQKKTVPVHLQLLGDYNVQNAMAAAGAAYAQGISLEVIAQGLVGCSGVPGRMERLEVGQPFTVVVDYAHTDDALRQVLTTLRKLKPARLITVFGCGGDRDRTKRPLMGESAARLSDEVIVTSDNPRSEDPSRIALDVEVGIRRVHSDHYEILIDRESAIARALELARPQDIVLIAGKGHETYQILGKQTVPFDDRDVARRILRQRKSAV